jgi:catechol 2,3-dioxygenase-like lactoylglutathione lyase family enzyme
MYQGRGDNQSYINHLGFHVEEFDSVMDKINQLGVQISYGDGIIEYSDSRSVYIADPDGMQIELSENFGGNL